MKKVFFATVLLSLFAIAAHAQESDVNSRDLRGEIVYQNDEVVFRQIDEHTWIGNGHRVYNESLYLVEGNDRAVLIDAGTNIPKLDKIAAGITSKPVTLMLTHGHGDHVGGAAPFPEVWVAPVEKYIKENDIKFLFPGHYSGDNLESPKRVSDLKEMCQEVLDGKRQGIKSDGNNGGNDMMIEDRGVRVTFSSQNGMK